MNLITVIRFCSFSGIFCVTVYYNSYSPAPFTYASASSLLGIKIMRQLFADPINSYECVENKRVSKLAE